MKFDYKNFTNLMTAPQYEGFEGYLTEEDKTQVPYQILMCLVESQEQCALFVKKLPVAENEIEIYEFNGNKLMKNHVVRIKPLDSKTAKYQRLVTQFNNKEFIFQ